MTPQAGDPVEVFYSYSHKDEGLRDKLETHLTMLKREGVITDWHDRRISAGQEWDGEIDEHLNSADMILLLVSADFLASNYCYDIEVKRAMKRHDDGEACVIPIILRPCDWQTAPFGKVQALPKDAKPVRRWEDEDEAFLSVAQGIRQAATELVSSRSARSTSPTETPKVSTPSLIPRPPIIGFVARREANGRDIVERLQEELAPPKTQLVTLSGPGGVGKTTLAAQAARVLKETFAGRVVWSRVEGRADFALSTLLDDIATQLGRADLRTLAPELKEAQVHALIADPPTLVVLDNYETIPPVEQKRIEAWLTLAQCSALMTSRQRIGSTLNITIAAMSRDEAREFLEKLTAQAQDPQLFSTEVRQRIYDTAEANPFVMQWVVGQIDAAQEPQTVLEELAHGEGDAAQRVFDRSFNLPQLGDDGRATLLALSLFAPSADRPALAEVAGFGDDMKRVNEAVKNLHALWLIKGIDGHRRFTIEGLTRTLAGARLSKDERANEFRQRFVAYFLHYAQAHPQPTPEDYAALEAEKDNLLYAIDVAFNLRDWESVQQLTYILAAPVTGVLSVHGYWDEAIRRGEQGLKAARNISSEARVALFAHNIAIIHQKRGELIEARRLYDESLEIRRSLGDQSGIAISLHQLGRLAQDQGELAEARRLYDESLEIKRRLGDQRGIAITLHELGRLAQNEGKLTEARRLYDESLEIARRLGDQSGIAITLGQLGLLAEDEGDKAEAARLTREALDIFEKLRSPYAEKARRQLERLEGESS